VPWGSWEHTWSIHETRGKLWNPAEGEEATEMEVASQYPSEIPAEKSQNHVEMLVGSASRKQE
jgi:hypothetical protein